MIKLFRQKNKARLQCLKHSFYKQGFSLVETLVAISIFSMTIITMMSVLGGGISNTTYAKNKTIAGYLAQEGIEYIINMRNSYALSEGEQGWNMFRAELEKCKSSGACGINSSLPVTDNNFIFECNKVDCKLNINNGGYSVNFDANSTDSGFERRIKIEIIDNNKELKINSTVSWRSGNTNPSVTLSQNLLNWIE